MNTPSHDPALTSLPSALLTRAKGIKLLAMDVDGVLTDGRIIYDANGVEQKCFNVKDGWALKHIKTLGIKTAIITGRSSKIVARRGQELDVDFVYQGVRDKGHVLEELLATLSLPEEAVAYIGDDIPDLPLIQRVGLSACPADAVYTVKQSVHHVLTAQGGQGALRELADVILYANA